jgi:hypothetical protein
MIEFKGSHFEQEVILWGGALVRRLSNELSAARGNDGGAGRGGRPLHPQSLGNQARPIT